MHIVGRIRLPKSVEVSNLYINCDRAAAIDYSESPAIFFDRGGIVSSNTYFNSLYENFYAKYTNLDSLSYRLKLEGNFQISVYRELSGTDGKELIVSENLENCQATDFVKVNLPNLNTNHLGRIYFELTCLSENGVFQEGLITTEQQPTQEVSLAIITCTYKKEAYIKNTVKTIVQDQLLQTKQWQIFVVDNGKTLTLEDFPHSRVQFIPSRNVGGSGGFTRGLVEALESNGYTHFLFMDDDIDLDSESIFRLFSLYEYAKSDFAIAGSMLDLAKKYLMYEAGLLYSKNRNDGEFKPFSIVRLKHNINLQEDKNLNLLLLDEEIDCGGFYFFCVSKKVVEQIGLLLPVFVKMDDLEFCLRIKNLGSRIVSFPTISVWHETFFNKASLWDYYYYRNDLITQVIHKPLKFINAVSYFSKQLIFSLLLFDYNHVEMLVKAFEDCVKGPGILKNNDPERFHREILELSKSYKTQTVQPNYSPPNDGVDQKERSSVLRKAIGLLTLNGHLLPDFLTSNDDVFIRQSPDYAGQRSKALAKKRVLIFKEEDSCLFQNEIDKSAGIKLLTRWLKVVASSSVKWTSIREEWKAASKELTSNIFWQEYLDVEKSKSKKVDTANKNLLTT
ncbi:MAG TPA: glycosyl transferase family 2 [Cyanobacteria bacterium UBA11049]|nr:glycosyl transferase family 2 [Cyanobacteria bacterium UBA11049]